MEPILQELVYRGDTGMTKYIYSKTDIDYIRPEEFSVNLSQYIVCCCYTNKVYLVYAESSKRALRAVLDIVYYSKNGYTIKQVNKDSIANYTVTHYTFEEVENIRNQNIKVNSQRYYVLIH